MKDNLEDYLRFSQVERGLSPNTIVSYRTDLEEYLSYLEDQNETPSFNKCPKARLKADLEIPK